MAKRALCVGINDYPGTDSDLSGCVNDAKDWAETLEARGYAVTTLLDGQATRKGLVDGLTKLMSEAEAGDFLVFTFSGHGSWLPDDDADEPDTRDEMLCPHDVASQQYLMDDELAEIFSHKPKDANLYFISDSCHSGSVARFSDPLASVNRLPKVRLLPPLQFVKDEPMRQRILLATHAQSSSGGEAYPALLLSGCKDIEFSYDADFGGRPNGAMTRAAIDELKNNPKTMRDWFNAIRTRLPSRQYPQSPQLFGSAKAKKGPLF